MFNVFGYVDENQRFYRYSGVYPDDDLHASEAKMRDELCYEFIRDVDVLFGAVEVGKT